MSEVACCCSFLVFALVWVVTLQGNFERASYTKTTCVVVESRLGGKYKCDVSECDTCSTTKTPPCFERAVEYEALDPMLCAQWPSECAPAISTCSGGYKCCQKHYETCETPPCRSWCVAATDNNACRLACVTNYDVHLRAKHSNNRTGEFTKQFRTNKLAAQSWADNHAPNTEFACYYKNTVVVPKEDHESNSLTMFFCIFAGLFYVVGGISYANCLRNGPVAFVVMTGLVVPLLVLIPLSYFGEFDEHTSRGLFIAAFVLLGAFLCIPLGTCVGGWCVSRQDRRITSTTTERTRALARALLAEPVIIVQARVVEEEPGPEPFVVD